MQQNLGWSLQEYYWLTFFKYVQQGRKQKGTAGILD